MNAIGISTTIAVRMRNCLPISRCCHHIVPTISNTRTLLFSSTTSENGKECDNNDSSSIISGTISSQQKPKQGQKAKYLLPKRIILLRHGESLGNIDDTAYATIPDWKIPMTRRGERQALGAAKELAKLLDGESVFAYCSPYKRAVTTWEIIEDYLENHHKDDDTNNKGVGIIGMREEPRVAEQQFGNFQNPHKVRTAKAERRTFGRFFFRFPNGESGLDVYNRCSSFLATLSRDIKQIDQRYSYLHRNDELKNESESVVDDDDNVNNNIGSSSDNNINNDMNSKNSEEDGMENMNILVVCHGLTLRLLLMRYFQLTVEEFENSYNSQNAKLVVMNRFVYDDLDAEDDPGNRKYYCTFSDTHQYREYYTLDDTAKEALNLLGEVSSKRSKYKRGLSKFNTGILLVDGDDDNIIEE
ncbi:phosphoglycerate mutase-like protein [Fragilariopsis cylindrus CCMP1102]|uniref:Phosphoglycerate mutase-like protein n=1 Tax=Fragilariopsis cylindrus CCMP1102 TaxID=635003 RepID=A0A1E7F717_9STRA|nr:phosphoglycerate mutase-like protein [Fragilariopsis cylindrus CCMP1102]|eukprot:OEU13904.1 phosphoglycerate mutase-like protein [Fragilariopsis cylindrus CCMP1102]